MSALIRETVAIETEHVERITRLIITICAAVKVLL